ncbi:hypothetical protein F4813DRAFT_397375 [Daldinia decipiens]|uniref:uncharacterized protein n=1 Tax=Daldinia decipiens TaxID=326647 RepID=UPI0020C4EB49|nr:uncharacterized protein F4813DRAFT_397375 [Daldinia decipiens]KAI1656792.1 hypothetical protein F4813DRAFT_397375 [Daldinia decipiens]
MKNDVGAEKPLVNSASPIPLPRKDTPSSGLQQRWNTKNIGLRLGADLTSAACAASIMENASGRNTLANSLRASFRTLLVRPHAVLFSKPVALIFMLYGGTYWTANTLDTVTSTALDKPAMHVTTGTAKFAASSAANVGLCVYKDQVFVKMFGPGGPPRPVPVPSYVLFTLRDCLTIFASFNVPPLLGPVLNERMGTKLQKKVSGTTIAQFAAPAAVQLFSTPVHLLGLDMYNRPGTGGLVSWRDRWMQVRKNWAISAVARICRIVPAFGLGGTVNTKVRRNLMERLA